MSLYTYNIEKYMNIAKIETVILEMANRPMVTKYVKSLLNKRNLIKSPLGD